MIRLLMFSLPKEPIRENIAKVELPSRPSRYGRTLYQQYFFENSKEGKTAA
jgi:hypothetical protein